ncbi:CHRD domain-containing protein [Dactylosporangium fulvum]|uniref:CHRD domain-containing protein n=1 Tax=Dactylosporangium fulvum TaxID=53359 RepID=A0ABY5W7Q6_9ACTN|nr:CHRD domain-containing protein [Dactylosporangium fulvum]UWP84101.1 CHRD domain-containing protein [Dactylosporangium fulvum]
MRAALALTTVAAVVSAGVLAGSPASAAPPTISLGAYLTGRQEVPKGSGDPDATGIGLFQLHRDGRLCYVLRVRNVTGDVTQAHIHAGRAGRDGDVVAPLSPPAWHGSVADCRGIGSKLARKIASNPARYYVNVHSTDFKDGALRGQLHRA